MLNLLLNICCCPLPPNMCVFCGCSALTIPPHMCLTPPQYCLGLLLPLPAHTLSPAPSRRCVFCCCEGASASAALYIDLCDRKPFGSDLNDRATDTGVFTVW